MADDDETLTEEEEEERVVFRWSGGCRYVVMIAGSWADWTPQVLFPVKELAEDAPGVVEIREVWKASFDLPSPAVYRYKFIVDGDWKHDEAQPAEMNEHGSWDNVVKVGRRDYDGRRRRCSQAQDSGPGEEGASAAAPADSITEEQLSPKMAELTSCCPDGHGHTLPMTMVAHMVIRTGRGERNYASMVAHMVSAPACTKKPCPGGPPHATMVAHMAAQGPTRPQWLSTACKDLIDNSCIRDFGAAKRQHVSMVAHMVTPVPRPCAPPPCGPPHATMVAHMVTTGPTRPGWLSTACRDLIDNSYIRDFGTAKKQHLSMVAHMVTPSSTCKPASMPCAPPLSMVAHMVTGCSTRPPWLNTACRDLVEISIAMKAYENRKPWLRMACADLLANSCLFQPKMTYSIVMIRHGESEWNKENRFCGWFDAGLSDKGKDGVGADADAAASTNDVDGVKVLDGDDLGGGGPALNDPQHTPGDDYQQQQPQQTPELHVEQVVPVAVPEPEPEVQKPGEKLEPESVVASKPEPPVLLEEVPPVQDPEAEHEVAAIPGSNAVQTVHSASHGPTHRGREPEPPSPSTKPDAQSQSSKLPETPASSASTTSYTAHLIGALTALALVFLAALYMTHLKPH